MKKVIVLFLMMSVWTGFGGAGLFGDVYLINGQRVEGEVHEVNGVRTICTDEMCMEIPEDAVLVSKSDDAQPPAVVAPLEGLELESPVAEPTPPGEGEETYSSRLKEGLMGVDEFLGFLKGEEISAGEGESPFAGKSWPVILLIVLLGGLAMNLTPCVLPMMPINLMIIGKSASRGALYGLGIAIAYGTMGLLAALGGMAFGEIQGNPWFNLAIAALFVALGLSLFGVFMIDFSKPRQGAFNPMRFQKLKLLFPLVMGVVSAVLAGACVAPILIAVLLLTAKLYAGGNLLALGLPFVLGLGMALPWPFAGAGLQVLPKPGAWMAKVNKLFGLVVFAFAGWYAYLAISSFTTPSFASPAEFSLEGLKRPVLIDCWATWCKNCTAMEKTTLADPKVKEALEGYTVVRLQAEKIKELKAIPLFKDVKGLPAFIIVEDKEAK